MCFVENAQQACEEVLLHSRKKQVQIKFTLHHNTACLNHLLSTATHATNSIMHKNQPSKLGFSVIPFTWISCKQSVIN